MVLKKASKKKPHAQPVKAGNWMNERHPGVALTMAVGIILILAVSLFCGMLIANMSKPSADCTGSSDAGVCAVNGNLTVKLDPVLSCGTASCSAPEGKVSVIAFYSPTCPYCESQYEVFQQLELLYGDSLDVKYACRDVHSGDEALCKANNESRYLDWETSQELASQFGADEKGTPVVVFNCKYQRYGSLALQNETLEYNELKSVIDGLL